MIKDDFLYNGYSLSNFNLIMCDPEEDISFASREVEKSALSTVREKANYFSAYYSDTLVLKLFVVKDPCSYTSQEDGVFTDSDINNIRGWLETPKKPCELTFKENGNWRTKLNDELVSIFYYGVFSDIQPFVVAGECYGLYLTFTCDSPYCYCKNVSTYNVAEDTDMGYLVLLCNSADNEKPVYPLITINLNATGSDRYLKISVQKLDSSFVEFGEMEIVIPDSASESITIDCEKKIIYDNHNKLLTLSDLGLSFEDTIAGNYFYWIRFDNSVPKSIYRSTAFKIDFETNNNTAIDTISLTTNNPVKIGGF